MAANLYQIIERRPADSLVVTNHVLYFTQVWFRATLRNLAGVTCVICGNPVGKEAYRPLTNFNNRRARMCVKCAEQES